MKNLLTTLLLISLGCTSAFSGEPVRGESPKIEFNGLTGTIPALFGARPKASISLGSYYLDPEELVARNFDAIFDCDGAGNAYLSGDDDVYYERFSNVLSDEIMGNLLDIGAYGHVLVNAFADGNVITISFDVQCTENSILPLYFDTVNGDLKLSASIDCEIEYHIAFDLELDSEIVNGDDMLKGVNIALYDYSIEIKPIESDSRNTAKVVYNYDFHEVFLGDESVSMRIDWRLSGNGEDTEEPQKIAYERLTKGDYTWEIGSLWNVSLSGMSGDSAGDETEGFEIYVNIDDTTDIENQIISVIDTEGSKEFRVRQLRFRMPPERD